ncbi:MAG: Tim44 domain-containing protein [Spirochaetota bacterium]
MLKKIFKVSAAIAALVFITMIVTEQFAYARAGGGRSFGSRGSRSFSSPSSSMSRSTQPARNATQPSTPYSQPAGGGFLRSLGMGMAGGFLGSMLFRGLGYGGTGWGGEGGGGGGIGLIEILVIGGLGLLLYRMYKRRKEGSGGSPLAGGGLFGASQDAPQTRESDLSDIKMSDPSFDEVRFKDNVMDMFFKIQAAWMNRDLSTVNQILSDEMKEQFQGDIDEMLGGNRVNRLENIAVRTVDLTEAWQDNGQDYITTLIYANILDYTVDDKSGNVISGSKTEPVKFEEYWTFTRPSRAKKWMLSAINQA